LIPLVPIELFYVHFEAQLKRAALMGGSGLGVAAFVSVFLQTRSSIGNLAAIGQAALVGVLAFLAFAEFSPQLMGRFLKWRARRLYSRAPRLVGDPPDGDFRFTIPMCADLNAEEPVSGTFYLDSDSAAFVPLRKLRRPKETRRYRVAGSHLRVQTWERASWRSAIDGIHFEKQLDFVGENEVLSFLVIAPEIAIANLALLIPGGFSTDAAHLFPGSSKLEAVRVSGSSDR
jgi:hypothetical protein